MKTGAKIKSLRKQFQLTQEQLGSYLGVKKNAVSKWECGRVEAIPLTKLHLMALLFRVPVSYLVEDDPELEQAILSMHFSVSNEDPQIIRLLHLCKRLNANGLARLGDCGEDLAGNPIYQKRQRK